MIDRTKHKAFTLIELLIVVAIIAILAAIAVPNFLEAQVRSKVSRILTDMRTNAVAIEAYQVDHNDVMPCKGEPDAFRNYNLWIQSSNPFLSGGQARRLTSPIAYLSQVTHDVFNEGYAQRWDLEFISFGYVYYGRGTWIQGQVNSHLAEIYPGMKWRWFIQSSGPDLLYNSGPHPGTPDNWRPENGGLGGIYDPTNGAVSAGDIYYNDTLGLVGGGRN